MSRIESEKTRAKWIILMTKTSTYHESHFWWDDILQFLSVPWPPPFFGFFDILLLVFICLWLIDFFSCIPLIHHHNLWDNFVDFLSRTEYLNIIWVRPIFNKYQERFLLEFLVDNFNSNSGEFFFCNRFEESAKYVRVVFIASDINTGLD